MTEVIEKIDVVDGTTECFDPECDGVAEVDQDGDHRWFECPTCGGQFGWERIETTPVSVGPEGACSIGVPEALRRAASAPMEHALRQQQGETVNLGTTIPVRRADG